MELLNQPGHDGSSRYVPRSQPALGETVPVYLRAPAAAGVRRVHIRSTFDGEPRYAEATVDRVVGPDTWWRAEVQARNPVTPYRFLLDTAAGSRWLTGAGLVDHDVPDATDFRLVAGAAPPVWAADAVVYQIFPDRFARSAAAATRPVPDWAIPCDWDTPVIPSGPETPHQLYGGDLDGIVEHLDHIAGLGVDTVYLTPIFPAPSNHRYNAAAFDRVDPVLGGDGALIRLSAALHGRGLRLIGDLTTNHCGDTHPWFAGPDSDPSMFYWDAGDYESWLGEKSLPKFNWNSPALRERFVREVALPWLRQPYDVDGWRVDVANMTGRRGADDLNHEVARLLRAAVRSARPDALFVAEHAHDATPDLDRGGWDATMNYAGLTRPLWSWLRSDELALPDFLGVPGGVPSRAGPAALATMRAFAAAMSWRSLTNSWTMLGSHDSARIRTVVGSTERVELALGLQLTLPGVPMIFAGDELGVEGVNGEDARRPMPWGRSVLPYYPALIALRRSCAALRHGALRWAYVDDDTLCFVRETDSDRILVLGRRAPSMPVRLSGLPATEVENLYGGAGVAIDPDGSLSLPGDGPTIQIWRLHGAMG